MSKDTNQLLSENTNQNVDVIDVKLLSCWKACTQRIKSIKHGLSKVIWTKQIYLFLNMKGTTK